MMSQLVKFDPALVRRYDVAGPRYTSYPTAVQFHEGFDSVRYQRHIEISNNELIPAPLSLYLHLPFCHSLCYYCGCTKKVTRQSSHGVEYLKNLHQEIALQARLFDQDRIVSQLHFGGGTPTFFDDHKLEQLMQQLRKQFNLESGKEREFSIEIDPRTIDEQRLIQLADLGFNRISLGVQDMDPQVQKAVNRVQDPAATLELVSLARKHGFESVSIDLIYGLPLQTRTSFEKTLSMISSARPDRLAVYNYAHMPHIFRSQRMINEAQLPSPEARLELMGLTIEKLCSEGYVYIGMDHFALPNDELSLAQRAGHLHRNFQGYSTRSECDLVGLGVSAIGKIGECYSQNRKEIPAWTAALQAGELPVWRGISLSAEDVLRRSVIESIMCHGSLDFTEYEKRYQLDFNDYFAPEIHHLEGLANDGLIELLETGLEVTPKGRVLLRHVAMAFDEYLPRETPNQSRFSRVI